MFHRLLQGDLIKQDKEPKPNQLCRISGSGEPQGSMCRVLGQEGSYPIGAGPAEVQRPRAPKGPRAPWEEIDAEPCRQSGKHTLHNPMCLFSTD